MLNKIEHLLKIEDDVQKKINEFKFSLKNEILFEKYTLVEVEFINWKKEVIKKLGYYVGIYLSQSYISSSDKPITAVLKLKEQTKAGTMSKTNNYYSIVLKNVIKITPI